MNQIGNIINATILAILSAVVLTNCNNETKKSYYESGNLKSEYIQFNDTARQFHYYDSTELLIKAKLWSQDKVVLKVEYYSNDGIKFYESTLVQKNLSIQKDSSTIFITANPKRFETISYSLDSGCIKPDFWDFFTSLSQNLQIAYDSSQSKYVEGITINFKTDSVSDSSIIISPTDTIIGGMIFEHKTEILEDSTGIFTAEHDYFSYKF